MKIFKFTCGADEKTGVFEDETTAYDRRAEVDATFHFLPVTIEEITVPGYVISINSGDATMPTIDEPFLDWDKDQLKAWLDAKGIEYHAQLGEKKLRELCRKAQAESTDNQEDREVKPGKIAELCHEVNRAYCRSIGDESQPSWKDAPQWQKDSAINGVEFHLDNETTPEQSHENWSKEKVAAGWVYGEVKDPEKKEHPCLVPYDQLPVEQRTKDYLFKAVVDTFKEVAE